MLVIWQIFPNDPSAVLQFEEHRKTLKGSLVESAQLFQAVSGTGWLCGAVAFGYLSCLKPATCKVSPSNLCQICLAFVAWTIAAISTGGGNLRLWAAVYFFFLSGHSLVIKTHLLDLCKARHFGLAYSATNSLQAGINVPPSTVGRVKFSFFSAGLPGLMEVI